MSPKPGTPVSLVAPIAPMAAQAAANATAGAVESTSSNPATRSPFSTTKTKVGPGSSSIDSSSSSSGSTSSSTSSSSSSTSSSSSATSTSSSDAPAEAHQPDPTKKGWIEIVLKDEETTAQGGTRYRVVLPDGSVAEGTLDAKGFARVEGFDPGACKVSFPDLDEKTWNAK